MSTTPTLPADFFDKKGDKSAPASLPADFDFGEKTPSRKGGAGGSWEPETGYEKANRKLEDVSRPYEETFRREVGAAGEALGGLATGAARVATAPFRQASITPEEQKKYGYDPQAGPVGKFGQEIGRQVGMPLAEAAAYYKRMWQADPETRRNMLDGMLQLLPEGIGTGAGTVVGGKAIEAGIPTAAKAIHETPNPFGIKTRAVNAMTEAETTHGMAPADVAPIKGKLDEIFDLQKHGFKLDPIVQQIANYMDEVSKPKVETLPDGTKVETPGKYLTFSDIRKFRQALDQKIDWSEIRGTKMETQLKALRRTLDVEEIKSLYRAGGPQAASRYAKAKGNYRTAMKIEGAGAAVGGTVGTGVGIFGGAEAGRATGVPHAGWVGGAVGGRYGGKLGYKYGTRVMRAITEMGKSRESVSAAQEAAAELRAEPARSQEAARNFGKGESDVELALRRTGLPEGEQQRIRDIIRQNQEMRPAQRGAKSNPDAPTSEIWKRAKAEYVKGEAKRKGTTEKASPKYGTKEQPAANTAEATGWHNEALAQAKKELGPAATVSDVLKRAAEIQKRGRTQ